MSASGGKGGEGGVPPAGALSFALIFSCSATICSSLFQSDHQATGRSRAAHAGIAARRRPQARVKAFLWELVPLERRGAALLWDDARSREDADAVLEQSSRIVRVDTRHISHAQDPKSGSR